MRCGVILIGAAAAAEPSLPELPSSFTAVVEANILEKNYTTSMTEFYDYDNNRSRFDLYESKTGARLSVFEFYGEPGSEYRVVNGTACNVTHIPDGHSFKIGHTDKAGRMRRSTDIFQFGPEFAETYVGQRRARGVLCDVWTRDVGHISRLPGDRDVKMNYTLTYFFSADHWTYRTAADPLHPLPHRVPVRAEIIGTMVYGPTSQAFHHYYDYITFEVGPPSSGSFQLPRAAVCAVPHGNASHGHAFPPGIDAACLLQNCEAKMRSCNGQGECHEAMHCMMEDCTPFTMECGKRCGMKQGFFADEKDYAEWAKKKAGWAKQEKEKKEGADHDHDHKKKGKGGGSSAGVAAGGVIYGELLKCIEWGPGCLTATHEWGFGVSSSCTSHQCGLEQGNCLGHEHCHRVMADVQAKCVPFNAKCATQSFSSIEKELLRKEGNGKTSLSVENHPAMLALAKRWQALMTCFRKYQCTDEWSASETLRVWQDQDAVDDAVSAERAYGKNVAVGVAFAMLFVGAVLGQVAVKRFNARRTKGFDTLNETRMSRAGPLSESADAIVANAGLHAVVPAANSSSTV